ncbi:MAG: hypothetical protein U0694_05900 [Anaerolineae bacterium]
MLIAIFLSACATDPTLTPTPTHVLTGPTLEASATIDPLPYPSPIPGDNYFADYFDPTAAGLPAGAQLPPELIDTPVPNQLFQEIVLTATDGTQLFGDLYQQNLRVPGILLLTRNRLEWDTLPEQLYTTGFTVLAMDIRAGAGLEDFEVMLQALASGIADPGRLIVIGGGEGADLALIGCATDGLCDAAALLSPTGGQTLVNLMADFNPRPLLLAASEEDAEAYNTILALQTAATGEVLFQPFQGAGSGAVIVQNRPDMMGLLVGWVQHVLTEG